MHHILAHGRSLLLAAFVAGASLALAADPAPKPAPARPAVPQVSPEQKKFLEARNKAIKEAGAAEAKTTADYAVVLEKATRALVKEFPDHPQVYDLLAQAAGYAEGDKARALAKEVLEKSSSPSAKARAEAVLKRLDMIGKPLDIKFTAVDGREVDLSQMKGKVVLVDFWATWCGPCIAELPNVIKAYEKLHPKGFEIVGISFDQKDAKEKLVKFVAEKKMPWPQFYDGQGWGNKFGKQYGINSIPAMWLVDKKGNLVDVNARGKLEEKVEKLLAE